MKHPILLLFRSAWRYAQGRRFIFIATLITFFIANVIILMEPVIVGQMLNDIQENNTSPHPWNIILRYLLILLAIPFAFWAFHGLSRVAERKTAFHILKRYKEDLISQAFDLPLSWHRDHHSGETINKINRATLALFSFSGSLFEPFGSLTKLLIAYVVLFVIMVQAGLFVAAISVLAILSVIFYDRILMRQYDTIYKLENRVASTLHDYLTNIITVVAMRLKKIGLREVDTRIDNIFPTYHKNIVLNEVKWFSVSAIIAVMVFTVLASYVYMTLHAGSALLVGTLYTLYAYLDRISGAFYDFAWQYSRMIEQAASVHSAEDIIADFKSYRAPAIYKLPFKWKTIDIQHLYFTYLDEKKHRHHLEDFNLALPRGAKIALVGSSGGGKSTVMALLRGIYHASRVEVRVDGVFMPHGLQHLYDSTALFPQDPEVFADTLLYNITMGSHVSDEWLNKVINWSRLESVLKRLPKGLATNIAEKGVNLSGGEKQRLALARGLLIASSNDILLLDEPTSSLDARNERAIYEKILAEYGDRTIVASVHRLHLLPLFDYVYLIDGGKVLEHGSLPELIDKKSAFADLWQSYFKTHSALVSPAPPAYFAEAATKAEWRDDLGL
ncbi:ABC transporter ATP-binding protein [Candidatus Peregrinibacteria bacterium]|nr:ABC transporter ATP-binding protein [Candidatus Peregrinibacteria bacterium]